MGIFKSTPEVGTHEMALNLYLVIRSYCFLKIDIQINLASDDVPEMSTFVVYYFKTVLDCYIINNAAILLNTFSIVFYIKLQFTKKYIYYVGLSVKPKSNPKIVLYSKRAT